MSVFVAAFWAELLKARRSRVPLLTWVAFSILPLVGGLFMFILKDPERAKALGLISAKAQMTAATADWAGYTQVLLLGSAIAGAILYGFIAAWVFGRESVDRTAKEWLALPAPREGIVAAKFALIALWVLGLALWNAALGLAVGQVVRIPGWSPDLGAAVVESLLLIALLSYLLLSCVAFAASAGRGYLLPLAWAFLTMALAQIAGVLGWGEWFPWAVPGLLGSLKGPRVEPLPAHSWVAVLLAGVLGALATFVWWRRADHPR
jgi:ABC-2 type transport system permease protein